MTEVSGVMVSAVVSPGFDIGTSGDVVSGVSSTVSRVDRDENKHNGI